MVKVVLAAGVACTLLITPLAGTSQSTSTPARGSATAPGAPVSTPADRGAATALAKLAIDVPYTKYVLRNGLTLVVHEDNKAPVVHVNIWYHVGSKNEPRGQSGFAHLFEHLMFQGSENFNDDFFKATRQIGATSQNGTTSTDRTNYYQTVPKEALDTSCGSSPIAWATFSAR